MKTGLIRLALVSVVLGALALTLGSPSDPTYAKTVQLDFNGQVTDIVTTAPDVATLLIDYLGTYDGLEVNPEPSTKLVAGDIVSVVDNTKLAPTATVATNLKIALTPPPPPPAPVAPKPTPVVDKPKATVYSGLATWYKHGSEFTTASRQFPQGTKLRVVAVKSGKTVDVVVNDYGPAAGTGIALDLNSVAFTKLAPLGAGKIEVKFYKI